MPAYQSLSTPYYNYKLVAAGVSTAQLSIGTDASNPNNPSILRGVTWIPASTATGTVTIFDGTTTIMVIPAPITGATDITPKWIDLGGIQATSTKGFNITTGASVSVIAVGNF